MAKAGFWLKGAKGKLAGSTIYKSGKDTVMRAVTGSIKNPKTKAQMIQRIISKTTMTQYSAMKAICNHSFQGKSAGKECMARFASLNNRMLRSAIKAAQDAGRSFGEMFNFIPCKTLSFIPAPVCVAEGSLPQIYANIANTAATLNIGGNTYGDIIAQLGLQRGDQLTFLTVEKNANGEYVFDYARVILDPRNDDGTAAELTEPFVANGEINKPSFRNEGDFSSLTVATDTLSFKISNNDVAAAGVIASREVDGDWLRSTCVLVVDEATLGDDNISLEDAIVQSTETTPIYTNSQRYLNNAGVGGPQAGGSEGWVNPYPVAVLTIDEQVTEITENIELSEEPSTVEIANVADVTVTATAPDRDIQCSESAGLWSLSVEGITMPIKVFANGTLWFTLVEV